MVPNQGENPNHGLSVRDYLVSKFQFIHLRLLKFYNAHKDKPDVNEIQEAAQLFIEELPVAVFFVDLEGRFLYGNKRAETLSGYPRQEIIGKRYYETNFVGLNDLIKIASLCRTRFRQERRAVQLHPSKEGRDESACRAAHPAQHVSFVKRDSVSSTGRAGV